MPRKWSCSACLHSGRGKSKKSRKQKTSVSERSAEDEPPQEVGQQSPPPSAVPETEKQSEARESAKVEEAVQEKADGKTPKEKKKKEKKSKSDGSSKSPSCGDTGRAEKPKKKKKKKEKKEPEDGAKVGGAGPTTAGPGVAADVYTFDEGDRSEEEAVQSKEVPMDQGDSTEGELEVDMDQMDLTPCRQILSELQEHEEGWPFLKAVDTKKFPQYKKIIKKPMDFSTMMKKLKNNGYMTRNEFALDARQIFENCEVFNEDESPVGQAGHIMRNFFEKRWRELC